MPKKDFLQFRIDKKTKLFFNNKCLEHNIDMSDYLNNCVSRFLTAYVPPSYDEAVLVKEIGDAKDKIREHNVQIIDLSAQLDSMEAMLLKLKEKRRLEEKLTFTQKEKDWLTDAKHDLEKNPTFFEGKLNFFNNSFGKSLNKHEFAEALGRL